MKPDPKTRTRQARDVLQQIAKLCDELDQLLLAPSDDSDDDPYIGRRIRVSLGSHKGKRGVVTRLRGSLFYYITLDDGQEIYKKPTNFEVL